MEIDLKFHPERFELKTCMIQQQQITYRAYMDIPYCKYPKDPIQTMNIFVPKQNRLYDDHTAPILFVNQVGGYLPGPAAIPQLDHRGYGNINQLNLKDLDGNILSLKEDGTGSFLTYLKSYLIRSAQKELHHHACINQYPWLAVKDSEIEKQHYIKSQQGIILDIDWNAYIKKITRMKAAPAFDALDLSSPENEEFGDEKIDKKHFTMFSYTNSESNGILADEKIIKMMNPLSYINASGCTQHWRIRHGAFDRDTSIAIPVILGTLLRNNGYEVDLQLPWGLPHCGDYDLDEFFQWIDNIIK